MRHNGAPNTMALFELIWRQHIHDNDIAHSVLARSRKAKSPLTSSDTIGPFENDEGLTPLTLSMRTRNIKAKQGYQVGVSAVMLETTDHSCHNSSIGDKSRLSTGR